MPAEAARLLVREYQNDDEVAILDLFARSFHQPMPADLWRWRYVENPLGARRISLTFDESRLVAHYAGYPVRFDRGSEVLNAHQIGDTMTDLSVRHAGRGTTSVLARTAAHFYERFCEGRVAFNYGFNVANIQKFSVRFLRAHQVRPVDYLARDLRTKPVRPIRRPERWARGISFAVVGELPDEWDAFYLRVRHHYRFLVQRTSEWIRWRYLASPIPYHVVTIRKWRTLAGWMVLRIRDRRLSVGDFLLDPDHADAFPAAIRHLVTVLQCESVDAWCPPHLPWLSSTLHEAGLESMPEPQDLSLMCVPFMSSDIVEALRSELFYTMGDSDLF